MFSVPGWSVAAAKPKAEHEPSTDAAPAEGAAKTNKKRKRPNDATVTPDNMVDYWEKVIEGKRKPRPKRSKMADEGDGEAEGRPQKDKNNKDKKTGGQNEGDTKAKALKTKGNKMQDIPDRHVEVGQTAKKSRKDKRGKKAKDEPAETTEDHTIAPDLIPAPEPQEKLTPLQTKMRAKLVSARFRHLNETLYTRPSADSLAIFSESPEMFSEYHSGFRRQVSVWPENPVDSYISLLLTRAPLRAPRHPFRADAQGIYPAVASQHLPFTDGRTLLADLGCGDAKIASSLRQGGLDGKEKKNHKLKIDVRSFDLASPSPLVTKADCSNLPLADGSVDVAVFCLALMGTNWLDFIEEAWRILRRGGELWVTEIKSRFGVVGTKKPPRKVVDHSVGHRRNPAVDKKALRAKEAADAAAADSRLAVEVDGVEEVKGETDIGAFMEALGRRGFLPMRASDGVQMDNKMFVKMFFVKVGEPIRGRYAAAPGEMPRENIPAARKKKPRFTEEEEDLDVKETKILKPCVYKIR